MEEKNYQYVFSLKLAGLLMTNNQKLIRINHHLSGNGKDVYVFKKNAKVTKIIDEYIKNQRRNNNVT